MAMTPAQKAAYEAKAAAAIERQVRAGNTSVISGKNSQAADLISRGADMPYTEAILFDVGVNVPPKGVQGTPQIPLAGAGLGAGAGIIGGTTAMTSVGTTALTAAGALLPALAGVGGTLGTIAGVAGTAYGALQALGLGEGGGLFGNNLLGGDTSYINGIPLGGPGLAEPPAEMVEKEWHVNYDGFKLQYYLVRMPSGGKKIAMYNTRTKKWKAWSWRTPRLAVIGKNMPSHKMIVRLRKNLSKHRADAETLLKLTSPQYAAYKSRKRSRRR